MPLDIIEYRGISLDQSWVLPAMVVQLNKDLEMSGMDKTFEESDDLEVFWQELLTWVEQVLEQQEDQLMNFLYRVDVSQQKIYSNDGKPQWNLAKLILEREFQKVVLRNEFKS